MDTNQSYIKSVEQYFLNHAGKGIMLSPVDYDLINTWKARNIPLELVLSGIREAFSEYRNNEYQSIRNLKSISDIIETKIKFNLSTRNEIEESTPHDFNIIKIYLDKINRAIEESNESRVKESMYKFKDIILSSKCSQYTNKFDPIIFENEFLDDIYNSLNNEEKRSIDSQVVNLLKNYSDKFTEKAYKRSYKSHRNRLLKERFHIKIFDKHD